MPIVGLVYYSNTGATLSLVEEAKNGVVSVGVEAHIFQIEGRSIIEGRFSDSSVFKQLHECDAIIFASPTYMGGVAAQFKAFADGTSDFWSMRAWSGKLAAGITCGSSLNGDQSSTLQYLSVLASQHGMIWVNLDLPNEKNSFSLNRLGCQMGVVAECVNGTINKKDLETAHYLGKRVAEFVVKLNREI